MLVRVIDLFILSHGGNRNKQGEHVTSMGLVVLSSVSVLMWRQSAFEEILLDLQKQNMERAYREHCM